jgi:nicotinate-nucleotide adenylyltransferase
MEPPAWVFFQNPLHQASATAIRNRRVRERAASDRSTE